MINIEEYEETTRQYQMAIKWYRDKVFQNTVSESALNSIEKCYENYQYSIDRKITVALYVIQNTRQINILK